jgi:predicted DNA binding CopG/RHH family protein
LNVVSTLAITPPKIEELQFTPAIVDTSVKDATITVRIASQMLKRVSALTVAKRRIVDASSNSWIW